MSIIRERARAKINLTLRVLGRRADGYHALESLIVFADVGDEVRLSPGKERAVYMTGPYTGAIAGANLIDVTLQRLGDADPELWLGHVKVEKRLPIAAGIGGGSADAAAVMRAVRRINPGSSVDWQAIAASLGADVPVCLADRSSLVWGFGERVETAPGLPPLHAVLVCPHGAAPLGKTRSVFAQLSVPAVHASEAPLPLPAFANVGALIAYMREVGNDLRLPAHAVMPAAAQAEAALGAQPHVLYVSLSGAGPTSYGIFEDAAGAAAAAETLLRRHPDWWVVATTLGD